MCFQFHGELVVDIDIKRKNPGSLFVSRILLRGNVATKIIANHINKQL